MDIYFSAETATSQNSTYVYALDVENSRAGWCYGSEYETAQAVGNLPEFIWKTAPGLYIAHAKDGLLRILSADGNYNSWLLDPSKTILNYGGPVIGI